LLSRLRVGKQTSDDPDTFKSRQITIKANDTTYNNHPHIFVQNDDVNSYNERRLKSILGPELTMKVGARVMLLRNVDTDVGLFNGALGVVTGFLSDLSHVPTAVLVLFENQQLRKVSADRHPTMYESFTVEPAEARFSVRKGNSVVESKRLQFPLKVAFAMTIHRC